MHPNRLFMDIHKQNASKLHDAGAFDRYDDYLKKIGVLFSDVAHEHRFWLKSGENLKSLRDFYEAIDGMSDEVYSHHAHGEVNDFALWVEKVYRDAQLARELGAARTRSEAKRVIEKYIDSYMGSGPVSYDKGFFENLVSKLNKRNQELEAELIRKREYVVNKQSELESWEKKLAQTNARLKERYEKLKELEAELEKRLKSVRDEEDRFRHTVEEGKMEIAKEEERLSQEKAELMEKEEAIGHRMSELSEKGSEIETKHRELLAKKKEHEELIHKVELKKHEPVHDRIDELLSYAVTCIHNQNFREARDTMAKVRYYYQILPDSDPMKKDFFQRIVSLRKHIDRTLHV